MADCNETLRELDAFLDSELSEDTHLAIRAHLEGCPDCLQTFDFHAELKIVVAQKCRNDDMPPGLLEKLQACFGDPDELSSDDPLADDPLADDPPSDDPPSDDPWSATDELDAGPDGA